MGKAIATICGILFIFAFVVGAIQDWGWGVVLWPVGVIVTLCIAAAAYTHMKEGPKRRALAMREAIGKLEAEQGIPVATEGACRQCGKPLVVGAKFCAYCKAPTIRQPAICPECKTRNPEDANWCAECGHALHDETKQEEQQGAKATGGVIIDPSGFKVYTEEEWKLHQKAERSRKRSRSV